MHLPAAEYTETGGDDSLLDRSFTLAMVNWEVLAYAAIIIIAIGTRFIDLGSRPLHHDEAQHAFFSWQLYRGAGYRYDPMLHGPFLYQITAFLYFLFGVSAAVARLGPAIFGVLLVSGCYFLRPYLGKVGAIAAAVLMTFSPVVLYYSRFIRHDIFAAAATLGMFIAVMGYIRTSKPRYIYLGAVNVAVSAASHELTFITIFIFGSFLLVVGLLGGKEGNIVRRAAGQLFHSPAVLIGGIIAFFAVFGLFYTNFLTYPNGLVDGVYKGLTYWLGQHGFARGQQPWFYYLLILGVYEPLLILTGFIGGLYLFTRGKSSRSAWWGASPEERWQKSLTVFFLMYWFVMAVGIYSWAGEKMPWLAFHLVLPLIFLAGIVIDRLVTGVDWLAVRDNYGYLLGLFAVLLLAVIGGLAAAFYSLLPDGSGAGDAILQAGVLIVFAGALVYGIYLLTSRLGRRPSVRILALTATAVLAIYMVHSAWNVAYYNGANPVELLVYTQTTPATQSVAERVMSLSRDVTAFERSEIDVTGGQSLRVLLDRQVEWPFDWYLRDLKKLDYYSAATPPEVIDAEVVLVAAENKDKIAPLLGDRYVAKTYPLRWWYPEANYRGLNPATIVSNLTSAGTLEQLADYYLYRDLKEPLGSYDFILYVRSDLAPMMGIVGDTSVLAPASTPETSIGAPTAAESPVQ